MKGESQMVDVLDLMRDMMKSLSDKLDSLDSKVDDVSIQVNTINHDIADIRDELSKHMKEEEKITRKAAGIVILVFVILSPFVMFFLQSDVVKDIILKFLGG